jgi:hypothetical protein
MSPVGEGCWMRSKLEVGTFQSASSEVSLNNDLRAEELAIADADRESIDCGFEGPLDSHRKSIAEEQTKTTPPLGSLPFET